MFITVHVADTIKQGTVRVSLSHTVQVGQIKDYFLADHGGARLYFVGGEGILNVRETPAEIKALIEKAQRERDRMMLAGRALQALFAVQDASYAHYPAEAAKLAAQHAEALLAALDAREGE